VEEIRRQLGEEILEPRLLANSLWAFAKLLFLDEPLSNALTATSLEVLSEFGPQGLSNIAWACATML